MKTNLNETWNFPSWLSGFVDGDGCFYISFTKRSANSLAIDVKPSFSLTQHKRSLKCLSDISHYFNCGGSSTRFDKKNQNYKFEVRSLTDLTDIIIPHFEKYPLLTDKANDFNKFRYVCNLMKNKWHLNPTGLAIIISTAYSMNATGKRKYPKSTWLKILFKEKDAPQRKVFSAQTPITYEQFLCLHTTINSLSFPSWLSGFVDAEGCFFAHLRESNKKLRLRIDMSFQLDQYENSQICLQKIKDYFGCGYIIKRKTKMHSFRVHSYNHLKDKILPHFEKYPLLTWKHNSFIKFLEILHLTHGKSLSFGDSITNPQEKDYVIRLIYSMNPSGKRKYPIEYWLNKP